MGSLTFEVAGLPVPWARARTQGRRFFTSPDVEQAKRAVVMAAKRAGVERIDEGAVVVSLIFDYDDETTLITIEPCDGKATRPDVDNLAKLVLDALNGIAWRDDGQVSTLWARKVGKGKRRAKK